MIPKTGSTTVAKTTGQPHKHDTAAVLREQYPGIILGASIRNPVDRLVSIFNFNFGNVKSTLTLEQIFKKGLRNYEMKSATWLPQSHFVDEDTVLFPFEGLPVLRWLGYHKEPHLWNPSTKKWTLEVLQSHPKWTEVLSLYDNDWLLLDKLKGRE